MQHLQIGALYMFSYVSKELLEEMESLKDMLSEEEMTTEEDVTWCLKGWVTSRTVTTTTVRT